MKGMKGISDDNLSAADPLGQIADEFMDNMS